MTDTTEPERFDLRSHTIADDKKAQLLQLFPEIATEGGKIDFDRLKLALGEMVDVGRERYGMNWPGKADCFKTIQAPSLGTLLPVPEESVNWDTTENLIIEGDNLEVLKLLQKSYLGKVKLIYIDPPYNTGNDFIYPDNYSESLQTYLEYTGQVDAEGKRFGTNPDSDGRFHSRWMNMMFPRLYLSRNLLSEDGVILVSCDDQEVHNLRALQNEIFGEDAFVAQFVWRARQFTDTRAKTNVSTDHEYIVAYRRGDTGSFRGVERDESKFSNPDNDPRGPWMSRSILGLATREQRPNLHYEIVEPGTGRRFPPSAEAGWRYNEERMTQLGNEGRILFPRADDGRPREKKFRSELTSEYIAFRSIIDDVHTADGTQEMRSIFGTDVFPFPKPSGLISRFISQLTSGSDLVVDIFAGSGTTGHATIDANSKDAGHRKFILVQLPQPTGRDDFKTIDSITRERVRRVAAAGGEDAIEQLAFKHDAGADHGFRALRLGESNFVPWNTEAQQDIAGLGRQLDLHVRHIRQGRTPQDLLFEILIKDGFPPTTAINEVEFAGKQVFSAAGGSLLVCLERELTLELIRELADRRPERVVLLDEGFAGKDQLKANAVKLFESKGVVRFRTV